MQDQAAFRLLQPIMRNTKCEFSDMSVLGSTISHLHNHRSQNAHDAATRKGKNSQLVSNKIEASYS